MAKLTFIKKQKSVKTKINENYKLLAYQLSLNVKCCKSCIPCNKVQKFKIVKYLSGENVVLPYYSLKYLTI